MKKLYLIFIYFIVLSTIYCQTKITVKNDQIFINKAYSFDVIMVNWGEEIIVKNKSGEIIFNFIKYNTPIGFYSSNLDTVGQNSYFTGRNTFYTGTTTYYKVIDSKGNSCEIGYGGLGNRRYIAKYLLDNNLIRSGEEDLEAFLKFCKTRGNNFTMRK